MDVNKNIFTLLIAAAAGMAVFAGSAQAQQEKTTYRYDRKGNCIYSNFGGYETIYTYDGKSNLTNQSSTGAYPQPKRQEAPAPQLIALPRPTPYVDTDIHIDLRKFVKPEAPRIEKPVVVTNADFVTAAEKSDREAAIQRAKADAAQHAKNVKSARSFRNGE
jgi:hypothetical protein